VPGTLYLRIDLPCYYYYPSAGAFFSATAISIARSFATQVEPIVQVSPLAVRVPSASPGRLSEDVMWRFRPNDLVRYGKLYNKGGSIDLSIESFPPNEHEAIVTFVGLKTLADFKAAFDRTFSKVPLQDEHLEWSAEIRKAVAERRLVLGMTPEQAYRVTGNPVSVEKLEENGSKVEIWRLREKAKVGRDSKGKTPAGFASALETITFVDGNLSAAASTPAKR
jgi:hypothetical protein